MLYGQTFSFDYVYFDDADYVLNNSAVRSGLTMEGVHWAFSSLYMSNWHPLSWLSHMLDVSLFGVEPGGAHLHNVILHGINSLLLYVLLLRLSGKWLSACVCSLVFLVHPLHVESVAWIAERKDLLCALFFIGGLILYDGYRACPTPARYAGVVLCCALALMAKPMAVTFPLVLLIFDFFIYRQSVNRPTGTRHVLSLGYRRAIIEKLPLLALCAATGVVTIAAQQGGGALLDITYHSLWSRWATATLAYVTYLKQFLFPMNLTAFYPLSETIRVAEVLLSDLILLSLIAASAMCIRKFPLIPAGMCWYLVTLLPVIGLIQVGEQAHADRYMYLPSVGILITCLCLPSLVGNKYRQSGALLIAIFVVYYSTISYWQIGYWENRRALFDRILAVNGPNYRAHFSLAVDSTERGGLDQALVHAQAAVKMHPNLPLGYIAMGDIALKNQEPQLAEKYYLAAAARSGKSAHILDKIGVARAEQGKIVAALEAFEEALKLQPTLYQAQQNLKYYGASISQ